jgi:hypothetical protein
MLASKTDTVAYLLIHYPFPDAHLLYIGDDDKDEEVFPMIHVRQGVAVKVFQPSQASSPSVADFLFKSPLETLQWIIRTCHYLACLQFSSRPTRISLDSKSTSSSTIVQAEDAILEKIERS